MPMRAFDEWATPSLQPYPLAAIKDTVIGIEAAHYLDRLLNNPPSKEPLLSALGGFPFALRTHIENELEAMQSFGIKPLFVFSGMDFAAREKRTREMSDAVRANSEAWGLYNQHQAVRAVETFGNSGSVKPESLFRFFQRILRANKVDFMIAPYGAWAQLAYFEKHPRQFVDAIMGSSELFLFDVDRVITRFDFERSKFWWLSRQTCQDDVGKISADTFVDVCMLSGSSFLQTFPPLENPRKPLTIRDTASMMLTLGPNATALCMHYQDDPQVQQSDYLDRYRRARLAVKHHVILTDDGQVVPLDVDHAPSDIHEFIGLRLPEELYFYLSEGVIGPRVLNWLTSGELNEYPPLDNGESVEYQRLVRDQLDPFRTLALALLSQPLSRFYQRKDVTMRFWFGKEAEKTISHKDLVPSLRDIVSAWNVKESAFKDLPQKLNATPGTIRFVVSSLSNADFVSKSITPKNSSDLLVGREEILCNTLWRFLQLRGYLDSNHGLTSWGNVLLTALSSLAPDDHLEEAAFIAIELLRLNLLSANGAFATYIGAPLRGSETDKSNCLLISRVACLGKLRHKPIGFTGPLSRNLLAFHSLISAVRESLRDLTEMTLVNLLMNGDAARDRKDWTDLGLDLPFIDDNDCGLGIAVTSYLDELAASPDPTSAEARSQAKAKGPEEWFLHSLDVTKDLEVAFRLWDAVYQGVKAAGKEVKGGERWADVDKWLSERRHMSKVDNLAGSQKQKLATQLRSTHYTSMARLSYGLLACLAILGVNAGSAVIDLIPDNFDKVILQSGKPALVEFFAPWCGHCKTLAPIYEELAQKFAFAEDKLSIAKVDADEHKSLGKRFSVHGFPTLKWFDGKSDKPEDYQGDRDLESLAAFVAEKTGVKPKTKRAAPSKVEMLNDETFKKQVGKDKNVLVAFTAPWCGHCKSLAPTWETLANDFAGEPTVLVAKVDAEAPDAKSIAQEHGVTSYPTIKFFEKGSMSAQKYEGGRSEKELLEFLNEQADTHRMVGGGLDAKAGTIDVLDAVVSKFTKGESIASIAKEAHKVAKDLKDKSAEYYLKVFQKLETNEGYAQKELSRLQNLLKKGGLAPEKLDQLTVRSNILRQFSKDETTKDEL